MSNKMPRFESGKPLSVSSLNQMSEAIEKISNDVTEDKPTITADEWRKQFYKDIELPIEPFGVNFFLDIIRDAEKENKTITRIDAPPDLLKIMRNFGRSLFSDNDNLCSYKGTGLVGQLLLTPTIDVYLNNRLGGKIRVYLEKVDYREYEFPLIPL